MVTTLSPNASDTPSNPIPTCGNAAAITALPQPAKVNQNVPIASARYFFAFMAISLLWERKPRQGTLRDAEAEEPSFTEAPQAIRAYSGIKSRSKVDIRGIV